MVATGTETHMIFKRAVFILLECFLVKTCKYEMYISHYISVGLDPDINPDEEEEKRRLITQVLELQNTLDGKFVNFFLNLFDTHFYFQH